MKPTLFTLFLLLTFSSFAQKYPFYNHFAEGAIILKDGTENPGFIKWNFSPASRLLFRETAKGNNTKYSAEDIDGFIVGDQMWIPIFNFKAYSGGYPLLGVPSKYKHSFAQLIDTGKFNIYLAPVLDLDGISASPITYTNFFFQKRDSSNTELVPYPVAIRMVNRRYEKAKEDLYELFKDYPHIVEAIKNYTQEKSFYPIVDLVHEVNQQAKTQ